MNKSRIIELTQELASVPDNDTGYAKHYILEDIENELDAKPVMPKVFDDWYKNHEISGLELDDAIEELHRCMEVWELGYASNIGMWISKNPKVNYRICIEALMNGYEVSDDYGIETGN